MPETDANSELKSMIETVLKTVNGLASDVRSNSYKLDGLEARFEGVERKFEGLGTRFDGLETRFDGLEAKVDKMASKLESFGSDVKVLSAQFTDVAVMAIKDNGRISNVEKRVDDLESGVN